MSNFSFPVLSAAEITTRLSDFGIAALKQDDLANPTADLACSVYSSFLSYLDPIEGSTGGEVDFSALELLENPDHHVDAIRTFNLYNKVKNLLSSIHCENFMLRDLLKPERKRTAEFLSGIINFLLYRFDKLAKLQPTADELSRLDERHGELEAKISELNRELLELEVAREVEEPIVREIDNEVKDLWQTIQSLNKEQMSLKAQSMVLKKKNDAINDKISQADFELVTNAQENSKLLSKVVQSPEKLQSVLEEKKLNRSAVKNAERSAMLSVKERTTTLEVYAKACEKITRHFAKVQAVQEQVNSAKNVDKEIKALKTTISDQGDTNMSLEAKNVERQEEVMRLEELTKAMEKERDLSHTENTKKLNAIKIEMERKLQYLEPRERKAEALVAKGENVSLKADSVRESGKAKQQELLAKSEEIINVLRHYSNSMDPFLRWVEVEVAGGILATGVVNLNPEVARRSAHQQ